MNHHFPLDFPAIGNADILVVPGLGGSDPNHWQSHFERRHTNARRVEQEDWETPDLDAWAVRIAKAALETEHPVLVVAHSFGCLALARAATEHDADIDAALLVAPASPERFGIATATIARRLPVPTLIVSSENDPWLPVWQAMELARAWGSRRVSLGLAGHLNVAAGFGEWPDCDRFAHEIWQEAARRRDRATPSFFLAGRTAQGNTG